MSRMSPLERRRHAPKQLETANRGVRLSTSTSVVVLRMSASTLSSRETGYTQGPAGSSQPLPSRRANDGEFYVAGECRVLQSVIRQNDIDAGVSIQKRKAG